MTINIEIPETKAFEINILVRDSEGNPTGQRKSFSSDDAGKIWEFYMRHQGRPKRKKRPKKVREKAAKELPKAQEAEDILKKMYANRDD